MSAQCDNERTKVQSELQNCNSVLEELQQRMERLEIGQRNMGWRIQDVEKEMISKRQGKKLKNDIKSAKVRNFKDIKDRILTNLV